MTDEDLYKYYCSIKDFFQRNLKQNEITNGDRDIISLVLSD